MDNNTIIKVANRSVGSLSYELPELQIRRHFTPNEIKEVTFEEIRALYQSDGGAVLVKNYLKLNSEEALKELEINVEPEYFYNKEDVQKLMQTGSLEEFLDMLDFAPAGVLEMVKNLAVALPLNDVEKRKAIFEKLQFNVDKAIEIQNSKYDGGDDDETAKEGAPKRRVAKADTSATQNAPTRRIVKKAE